MDLDRRSGAQSSAHVMNVEFSKGRAMEAKLTELVSRLKAAANENLKAVVLYGSAVTGEFRAGHSDLNVLCIVEHAASAILNICTLRPNGGCARAIIRR